MQTFAEARVAGSGGEKSRLLCKFYSSSGREKKGKEIKQTY